MISTNFSDAINKNNVEISDLALMTDDIPEDAEELVIMSPTTDFSEDEANKVITYLENGGKLLMFTSYTGTDMPNLDSILENYGVKRSSGIVVRPIPSIIIRRCRIICCRTFRVMTLQPK